MIYKYLVIIALNNIHICDIVQKTFIIKRCLNYLEHQQVVDKYKQYYLLQEVQDNNEDSGQFIEDIGKLLDKLPEKRRRVLEMSVLESKSYAEIADALAISLNTVKDHIKKAYAFLRDEMHKEISSSVLFFAFYRRKNRGCK